MERAMGSLSRRAICAGRAVSFVGFLSCRSGFLSGIWRLGSTNLVRHDSDRGPGPSWIGGRCHSHGAPRYQGTCGIPREPVSSGPIPRSGSRSRLATRGKLLLSAAPSGPFGFSTRSKQCKRRMRLSITRKSDLFGHFISGSERLEAFETSPDVSMGCVANISAG